MLIVTMISVRTSSVLETQFLQVIGFHGVKLFSDSLIPVYHHRVWYFLVMGVKRALHVSKERRGKSRRGDEKKGWLIHLSAVCEKQSIFKQNFHVSFNALLNTSVI